MGSMSDLHTGTYIAMEGLKELLKSFLNELWWKQQ